MTRSNDDDDWGLDEGEKLKRLWNDYVERRLAGKNGNGKAIAGIPHDRMLIYVMLAVTAAGSGPKVLEVLVGFLR
jgi:hypothetical protein